MTDRLKAGLEELAAEVSTPDLRDRVLRGSRRITLRNRAVGSVAVVAALAGTVITFGLVRLPDDTSPPIGTPSPALTRSAEPTPVVDVFNATFEVPAFPGDDRCPAAKRTFVNGRVIVGSTWLRILRPGPALMADVDGKPGAEALVPIECGRAGQVLALSVLPGDKLSPLGWVTNSPDRQAFELDPSSYGVRVQDRTVLVEVLGPPQGSGGSRYPDKQARGYALAEGTFKQVSGPVQFGPAPTDYKEIDFRNTTVLLRTRDGIGYARMVDGSGDVVINDVRYHVTVNSVAIFETKPYAAVLYTFRRPDGTTTQMIDFYDFVIPFTGSFGVAMRDELAGDRIEVSGSDLKLISGTTEWTYRRVAGVPRWELVK